MFRESIPNEEIQEMEIDSFAGEITLVDNYNDVQKAVEEIRRYDTLGFDTETRPNFKKGRSNTVSLLQLSAKDKAWLFRLNMTGLTPGLCDILADPSIKKIGVAISYDIKSLKSLREFTPGGFIDLQDYVKAYGIKDAGLRKLTALVLGFRLSKSQQISDWEAHTLSHPQLVYAASDAWAAYEIYKTLSNGDLS